MHLWSNEEEEEDSQHSSHLFNDIYCCIIHRYDQYLIVTRVDERRNTLRDCCLFTPHIFDDNHQVCEYVLLFSSILFQLLNMITYQMLVALNQCQTRGYLPHISTDAFLIDCNFWINLDIVHAFTFDRKCQRSVVDLSSSVTIDTVAAASSTSSKITTDQPLSTFTNAWIQRRLSNLDYLLVLNSFAGRITNDIDNHPIIPWVCDFSDENGKCLTLFSILFLLFRRMA